MRYDIILHYMFLGGAAYSFATTTQPVMVRRGTSEPVEENEIVPILDSYDAIIWADGVIPKPTSAECDTAFAAMQQSIADKEAEQVQRQGDIDTGRATYPDRIRDPASVTLAELAGRVAWLENEIRKLVGL